MNKCNEAKSLWVQFQIIAFQSQVFESFGDTQVLGLILAWVLWVLGANLP